MPIGIRVTDLPAAAGTLDDDDEFLSLEDGSLRRATRAQAGPKASIVQVTDTANQFTGTNVEDVLAEIQDNVDALVISGGGMSVASEAEALAGTDNTKAITPNRLAPYIRRSGQMRRLMTKLKRGVLDASILVIGDSTGNGTDEWVYKMGQWLGVQFPEYTVRWRLWDTGTNDYAAATTIDSGTGTHYLDIWNCSISGVDLGYQMGSRFTNAAVGKNADLIFVSHGHNMGQTTPWTQAVERKLVNTWMSGTEQLHAANPEAGIVLIAQNPSIIVGREEWQAHKAQGIEQVATARGFGFLDVHQAFIDSGIALATLMPDLTHPSATGQQIWTDVVTTALARAGTDPGTGQQASPVTIYPSRQVVPSPEFADWAATDPDGWTGAATVAATQDTTNFETGTYALKLTSTATSGVAWLNLFLDATEMGVTASMIANHTWTLAVRVYVPASNTLTVRAYLYDNNGAGSASTNDVSVNCRDRFVWLFVTRQFPSNATADVRIGLACRTSGTSIVEATFDRLYLVPGVLPHVAGAQP